MIRVLLVYSLGLDSFIEFPFYVKQDAVFPISIMISVYRFSILTRSRTLESLYVGL